MASTVWRCQFQGRLASGALVRNSLHYVEVTDAIVDRASASAVADNIYAHIGAAYLAVASTDYHLDFFSVTEEVRYWAPYLEIGEAHAKSVSAVGSTSPGTDRCPDGMTAKIKLKTNAATRSGHGWLLLPGSSTASSLSATAKWEGGYWTGLQAFAALLDDTVSWGTLPSHDLVPVVYSETRRRKNAEFYYFGVTGATAVDTPGWLRRRMTIP